VPARKRRSQQLKPPGGGGKMKVAPGIYRAESNDEVIYALDCGRVLGLVDVGSEPALGAKLDELRADGLDTDTIAAVFLTHRHQDHCGGLRRLRQELSPRRQATLRVVAHRLGIQHLTSCVASPPIPQELVDYGVDEGDTVEVGEATLQVYHLPGHTPDSVAWQVGDSLFVGDVIFCDGGIGWMDVHWGSSVPDYRASLERLLGLKASSIFPGHRECGPITEQTIEQALARIKLLAEADGSPLAALGRTAPRRSSDEPTKIIRLATALSSES